MDRMTGSVYGLQIVLNGQLPDFFSHSLAHYGGISIMDPAVDPRLGNLLRICPDRGPFVHDAWRGRAGHRQRIRSRPEFGFQNRSSRTGVDAVRTGVFGV